MSRSKQNRIIDNVIDNITVVTQNQCSLLEEDLNVLNESLKKLLLLKQKKGKTNKQIRKEIANVVSLLVSFFVKDCSSKNKDGNS